MEVLIFVVVSFFAGYEYADSKPPIQVVVEHKVLVTIPCKVALPTKPSMPLTDSGDMRDDIFIKTKKALAEIDLRKGYEAQLESSARSCE